jgi:hypothetical protein
MRIENYGLANGALKTGDASEIRSGAFNQNFVLKERYIVYATYGWLRVPLFETLFCHALFSGGTENERNSATNFSTDQLCAARSGFEKCG